jgi:hypothetical protein
MLGGFNNTWILENGKEVVFPLERKRQFYLSLDLDTRNIKSQNAFFRMLLRGLNIVKIPAPALEYNKVDGFVFHLIHF